MSAAPVTPAPAAPSANRLHITCPHCAAKARARTSQQLSPVYREIIYQCTDVHCGHTFVAGLEVLRTLSPSATPNPAIHLPLSTHMPRQPVES